MNHYRFGKTAVWAQSHFVVQKVTANIATVARIIAKEIKK